MLFLVEGGVRAQDKGKVRAWDEGNFQARDKGGIWARDERRSRHEMRVGRVGSWNETTCIADMRQICVYSSTKDGQFACYSILPVRYFSDTLQRRYVVHETTQERVTWFVRADSSSVSIDVLLMWRPYRTPYRTPYIHVHTESTMIKFIKAQGLFEQNSFPGVHTSHHTQVYWAVIHGLRYKDKAGQWW